MSTRNQVFISYAHDDVAWKNQFTQMFNPAIRRGSINVWSDDQIAVGADWARNIDRALESASVGLLLVTPRFLESEFINDVELRRLLSLARTADVTIYWVPVASTLYTQTPLADMQAAWEPGRPLNQLSEPERQAAIQKICLQIVEDFGFLPKVAGGRRQTLPEVVQSRLGEKYEIGSEVGTGRFSIVYRAQQKRPGRVVGVKVFVASEFDDWASAAITETEKRAAELTSPAFIKIFESATGERPEYLVTEFVQGEPLSKYLLQHPQGVPLRTVRAILLGLTEALDELHQKDWVRGELCSSNILIEPRGAARLSALDCSTLFEAESHIGGSFLVDRESLAYMSPERFLGQPHTHLTDQYSLGLIATELLGGERLPRVFSPSDLECKRSQFEALANGRGRWAERSPEFAGFVARLLSVDPSGRWPSMRDAHDFLLDIEVEETEDEINRKLANRSYLRLQLGGTQLFSRFYQNLFAVCPDVTARFTDVDMSRQYQILNKAIQLLLDFDPGQGCTKLRDLAERHSAYGLTRRHYELFLEALLAAMEQSGVRDHELVAWRKTLTPAIDFMCTCQGMSSADSSMLIA